MGISDNGPPPRYWRAFYTMSRAEKKCEQRLEDQDVEVFLPKQKSIRQWSDRKKEVIEPLFRNYIFAHVHERERLTCLRTNGIVRCVSFGGDLAQVPEEEIEQLRITQNTPGRLGLVEDPRPPEGTKVTVVDGPLSGLTGIVMEHRGNVYLLIRVQSVEQTMKVQLSAEKVEEVE